MCFHENKREWMDFLLLNSMISVSLFFYCGLCKKYLDKNNHKNQRYYPFNIFKLFLHTDTVKPVLRGHLWDKEKMSL